MIVDEAERNRHIDAAEALLGLIPTVDLETSVMGVGGEGEEPANEVCTAASTRLANVVVPGLTSTLVVREKVSISLPAAFVRFWFCSRATERPEIVTRISSVDNSSDSTTGGSPA